MFLRKITRPGRTRRASRKLSPGCTRSLVFEEMCAASRTELVEPGGGLRVTGGRYRGCSSPFRMKRLLLRANRSTDDLRGLSDGGFRAAVPVLPRLAPLCSLLLPFLTLLEPICDSFIIGKNHTKWRARGPVGSRAGR